MSDADNSSFTGFGKFVPGFDFLQNLAKQAAGSATQTIPQMPSLGSWVAPTLNVEELDKRIQELKAVQFWLDQNAMALKATIQALEVQKMTLATLKGMNFNMGELANAFKLKVPESAAGGGQRVADKGKIFPGLEIPPSSFHAREAAEETSESHPASTRGTDADAEKAPAEGGVVDPLKWWGSLTQQFQTIATDAMKDATKNTAITSGQSLATGLATGLATDAMKAAAGIAKGMVESTGKSVSDGAHAAMNTALRSTQASPSPSASKAPAAAKAPRQAKPKAAAAPRKTASKPASKTASSTTR